MYQYRQYGVAPLNVQIWPGGALTAASYYFQLRPPDSTAVVALLSTLPGSHPDEGELDSADMTFHIDNNSTPNPSAPPAVGHNALPQVSRGFRAYLRPIRREHKLVSTGAAFNLVLVYLVSRGRYITGLGFQTLILLGPTALIGFIAQQQRHYYSMATRRQRGVLWVYLVVCVVFLGVVAFSHASEKGVTWGKAAQITFLGFGSLSAFLAVIYASLGLTFIRMTSRWFNNRRSDYPVTQRWIGIAAIKAYEKAVMRYCTGVFVAALVAMACVLTTGILISTHGGVRGYRQAGGAAPSARPRARTVTISSTQLRLFINGLVHKIQARH